MVIYSIKMTFISNPMVETVYAVFTAGPTKLTSDITQENTTNMKRAMSCRAPQVSTCQVKDCNCFSYRNMNE